MFNLKKYLLILVCCGLAAALAGAKARVLANQPAANAPVAVKLPELICNPVDFAEQTVTFACRYAAPGKLFRQKDQLFTQNSHANFNAWPAEAALWDKHIRRNILPSLYVSRENPRLIKLVDSLKRYELLIVTGRVMDSYANLPWIEIIDIQKQPENEAGITDALLAEISKGLELIAAGKRVEGARVLQSAVSAGAPGYIGQFAASEIERCTQRATRLAQAAKDPMALIAAGRNAAAKGDITAAIAYFRKAGSGESPLLKSVWFYRELGQFYLINDEEDHLNKAKNLFVHANQIAGGNDVQALYCLAQVAAEQKEFVEAEDLLNRCLKISPGDTKVGKLLAQITTDRLAQRKPTTPLADEKLQAVDYLEVGRVLLQQGKFTEAESNLRAALTSINAEEAKQAKTLLASALLAQSKTAEALELLENSTKASKATTAEATPALTDLNGSMREMNELARELDNATESAIRILKIENKMPGTAPAPSAKTKDTSTMKKQISQETKKPITPITRTTTAADATTLPDWAL